MSKLPNAPLQEVILEVKWELSLDQSTKTFIDPGFELALGKFHNSLVENFPFAKTKVPHQIPIQMLGHQTKLQFWTGENVWPVVQLGPGILAINDTDKNYEWAKTFYPLVQKALSSLLEVTVRN